MMTVEQGQDSDRIYAATEELRERKRLRVGRRNVIVAGDLACLSIVLFEDTGRRPIANADYRISGHDDRTYSGTTDDEGYLFHPNVPIDDYDLTVGDITVRVPVVLREEERHFQRVIDYELT
jgi:hypothetical protein